MGRIKTTDGTTDDANSWTRGNPWDEPSANPIADIKTTINVMKECIWCHLDGILNNHRICGSCISRGLIEPPHLLIPQFMQWMKHADNVLMQIKEAIDEYDKENDIKKKANENWEAIKDLE